MSLSRAEVEATVSSIARVQLPDGAIPWSAGGHVDPWNHVEAAMALDVGGRHAEARHAYRWLAATQRQDGAWPSSVRGERVEDATLDANFCAYIATGVWHHMLATGDERFVLEMWPAVERALDFVLDLQTTGGSIMWARDADHRPWPGALLTSSSCIHLSLGCGVRLAAVAGDERPDWELSLDLLAGAVRARPQAFADRDRFSMDWYYPVLGGVLLGEAGLARIEERWSTFVVEDLGARCVADRPWVTTAETCELVLSLDLLGLGGRAHRLFEWIQHLRADDGSYWTGATFPDGTRWPVEQTTWSAAAVILAYDALCGTSDTGGFFRTAAGGARPLSEPVADSF